MFRAALSFAVLLGAVVGAEEPPAKESPITIDCRGKLRTGEMAIGGETSGMSVDFLNLKWDLQFKDQALREQMKDYHKQPVTVSGKLRLVRGIERTRWVIDVDKIALRDADKEPDGAELSTVGTLKKPESSDESCGVVIDAGGATLPLDFTKEATLSSKAENLLKKAVNVSGRVINLSQEKKSPRPAIQVEKLEPVGEKTAQK